MGAGQHGKCARFESRKWKVTEMKKTDFRFEFGKNWRDFLNTLDDKKIEEAKKSLIHPLKMESLKNKTFIDIGCGSGLFSYCAYVLGAKKVVSIDIDEDAIQCCQILKEKAGNPANWKIIHGSILDETLVSSLQKYDIVYSFGVLHHTGNMWKALQNTIELVNDNGYLYLALYNYKRGINGSKTWLMIKKVYNKSPKILKNVYFFVYAYAVTMYMLFKFKNPMKEIKYYHTNRGMNFWTDLRDWIGGYPYEYASREEVINFLNKHTRHCELLYLKPNDGLGNNVFVFKIMH